MTMTRAVRDARQAIWYSKQARLEEGENLSYWCAVVSDGEYDLAPALRFVTPTESMPLTRELLAGIMKRGTLGRLYGAYHVVHILEDSDPLVCRDVTPDADGQWPPIQAIEMHVALAPGRPLTLHPTILRVSLGLDSECEFSESIVLGFDKRPASWPP
jgi:hypothetical protein